MTMSDLELLLKPLNSMLAPAFALIQEDLPSLKQRIRFAFDNAKIKTMVGRFRETKPH